MIPPGYDSSMPNVEIKCNCPDLKKAADVAERLGARRLGTFRQKDTYFRTPNGRLKVREQDDGVAQLIPYLRPDTKDPKVSDYELVPLSNPENTVRLLAEILGKDAVVLKQRTVLLLGHVRIHLDEVENLGSFLEFEAVYDDPSREKDEIRRVEELMESFGVRPADLREGSYRELITS